MPIREVLVIEYGGIGVQEAESPRTGELNGQASDAEHVAHQWGQIYAGITSLLVDVPSIGGVAAAACGTVFRSSLLFRRSRSGAGGCDHRAGWLAVLLFTRQALKLSQ